ncbi:1,6-anhydro-N-acetylmuramyl-L-alanine amidase AmpD [Ectothiorhodospiraceae bacterium 2226]|nr:1,6-anhydro-N-acetylmuramyl-L-alanine amidase AmpD [Ectothiorhodospiraceae bacterium 2226]
MSRAGIQRERTTPGEALAVDPVSGLIPAARLCLSPNCDERPAGVAIDLLVVHGISLPPLEFGGPWIDALFTNTLPAGEHPFFAEVAALRVSAHALIRRDGELVQYVPLHRRAWHAGVSCHGGRERCNDYSIGVELEGGDQIPYTDAQYAVLARLARGIMRAYPDITPARIVGHCDIAPGRKTDPGPAFEWDRLRRAVSPPGDTV